MFLLLRKSPPFSHVAFENLREKIQQKCEKIFICCGYYLNYLCGAKFSNFKSFSCEFFKGCNNIQAWKQKFNPTNYHFIKLTIYSSKGLTSGTLNFKCNLWLSSSLLLLYTHMKDVLPLSKREKDFVFCFLFKCLYIISNKFESNFLKYLRLPLLNKHLFLQYQRWKNKTKQHGTPLLSHVGFRSSNNWQ